MHPIEMPHPRNPEAVKKDGQVGRALVGAHNYFNSIKPLSV
jgi:hypothetical protein